MQKEEMAFVGCRLLALFYAMKVLETLGSVIMITLAWKNQLLDFPTSIAATFYVQTIPLAFYGIITCLLWFGAGTIVKTLVPETGKNSKSRSISAEQAQSIAFAAIGLLVLTWGISGLVNVLYQVFQLKKVSDFSQISITLQAEGITVACRILLGLCLVFGFQGFSRFLIRLRQPKLN